MVGLLFLVLVRDLADDLLDESSMVMMPAVPPYSSTTTATWMCSL